jgi:hypothetical protein
MRFLSFVNVFEPSPSEDSSGKNTGFKSKNIENRI